MRFLVDENLSPLVAAGLCEAGHDAVHVSSLGLSRANDQAIVARAVDDNRVVLSADTDFGTVLAESGADRPSVVLIRRAMDRRAISLDPLVLVNLEAITDALEEGAIVVLDNDRVRVRRLPLR